MEVYISLYHIFTFSIIHCIALGYGSQETYFNKRKSGDSYGGDWKRGRRKIFELKIHSALLTNCSLFSNRLLKGFWNEVTLAALMFAC